MYIYIFFLLLFKQNFVQTNQEQEAPEPTGPVWFCRHSGRRQSPPPTSPPKDFQGFLILICSCKADAPSDIISRILIRQNKYKTSHRLNIGKKEKKY